MNKGNLACDIIAISDTGMVAPNTGTLGYGLRGIACAEVKITGPARDLHSGLFGGAVANPATAIAVSSPPSTSRTAPSPSRASTMPSVLSSHGNARCGRKSPA